MSMKLNVKGMDDILAALNSLNADTEKIVSDAMYDGAKMLIEECKKNIQNLPVQNGYLKNGVRRDCCTEDEKTELLKNIGIASFQKQNGKVSTAIGFHGGYTSHKTKKYPNGVPIVLIARSIESGSSVRVKHPFMRTAVNSTKEKITRMMQEKMREDINKLIGG